jgi:hypothetical protein
MTAYRPAFVLLATTSAGAGDVSGEYKVRNDIAGNVSEMTCTLTQKESAVTGNCVTEQGQTVEIAGNTQEDKIDWVFKSLYEGNPITLTYKGSIAEGKISGNVTVEEFNVTGEFTATPAGK